MHGVTASELEEWANTYPSKADFPRLLCRLICGTCRGVKRLEVSGGEHVYLSGLDGLVICETGNAFVPSGASVWELSTESSVISKANEDYEKRTKGTVRVSRPDTTFVFATPRRWAKRDEWQEEKEKNGPWKHVRALSSADVATCIDNAPWLSDAARSLLYGGASFRIKTAQVLWENYSAVLGVGPLDAQFIMHAREKHRADLIKWLEYPASRGDKTVRISGPSQTEVLHFIAATIHAVGTPASIRLGNRVFFVEDADALRILRNLDEEHVVMIDGSLYPNVVPFVSRAACKTIIVHRSEPDGIAPLPTISSIEIPPMSKDLLLGHIVRQGYNVATAEQLCKECTFDYAQIRRRVFLC